MKRQEVRHSDQYSSKISPLCESHFLPESAAAKIGETVEMVGEVVQVSNSKNGALFLNFGARYPNQVIYGYVSSLNVGRMGRTQYLESLEEKTVELKGQVELYKGKPQIGLRDPRQITL